MIFRYFVILLIFSVLILSGIVQHTYAVSVVAVTESGSSFPIILESSLYGNGVGNGTSILDGLGVYMVIDNFNTNGQIYFGSGNNPGSQTDIRQYVEVGPNDDWAVAMTDDDDYETLYIPEFRKEYIYSNNALTMVD